VSQPQAAPLDAELAFHQARQGTLAGAAAGMADVQARRAQLRAGTDYLRHHGRTRTQRQVAARDEVWPLSIGPVRVRRYLHDADAAARGMLVYFHGGGWVAGDLDSHDELVRHLLDRTGLEAVAVDYARAPEAVHPLPVEQACAVLAHLRRHNAGVPLVAAGDSAGAHIAAAAAHASEVPVQAMLLFYPVVRPCFTTTSYRQRGASGMLTLEAMRWSWSQYLGRDVPGDGLATADPTVDLMRQHWRRPAPATVVCTAWHDPLCDEGAQYAQHLGASGARVACQQAADMNHGFARYLGVSASACTHVDEAAATLLELLDATGRRA